MKNMLVIACGLLLVAAGAYFLIRPNGIMVAMPQYANAEDQFGFIESFEVQNGMTSFRFDEAEWITGEGAADMPNGFTIENPDAAMISLWTSPSITVRIVDLTDPDDGMKEVTLDYLQDTRGFNKFSAQPFWISFDGQGRVSEIREQYTP